MVWQDHAEIRVEWGRRGSSAPVDAVWNVSVWDGEDRWVGSEPSWVRLDDCEVRSLQTRRGRTSAVQAIPVGTATVDLLLLDSVAGEEVPGDRWSWRSEITIGDEMRIRGVVKATGITYPIFRGDVRAVADVWDPDGRHGIRFNLTDLQARLGRIDLAEGPVVGAGERSGERMGRIAELAEIPTSRRRFDPGLMTLQGTNFARNLAGEAEVTTTSEGGDLFAQRDGRLAFRQRAWWQTDPRATTVRVLWSNVGGVDDDPTLNPAGTLAVCPLNLETRVSLDLVENQITFARDGGEAITVRDSASRSLYGLQTHRRLDLMNTSDDDVASLAAWRLAETSQRTRVVDGVDVNPLGDPDAWTAVLDSEIGDLHRLVWDDGDDLTDLLVHVQGVEHRISAGSWSSKILVWDRYAFTPAAGWDVDDWDVALWN
jgi:hypothetical protein